MQQQISWREKLSAEFEKEYYKKLLLFLGDEEQCYTVFPPKKERFNAYNTTPFENVKVVILGQDPYHGTGQAHGLSFSVKAAQTLPPSLKNIYKELVDDMDNSFQHLFGYEFVQAYEEQLQKLAIARKTKN